MTKVPCGRAPDPALAPNRGIALLRPKMWQKIHPIYPISRLFSSEPEITSLAAGNSSEVVAPFPLLLSTLIPEELLFLYPVLQKP